MKTPLDNVPVLWVARCPGTDHLFIDADEDFVRGIASTTPGATVLRIDVPALLRVAHAARRNREIRRSAAYVGRDIYQAWGVEREEFATAQELDAALATFDIPTDPTS